VIDIKLKKLTRSELPRRAFDVVRLESWRSRVPVHQSFATIQDDGRQWSAEYAKLRDLSYSPIRISHGGTAVAEQISRRLSLSSIKIDTHVNVGIAVPLDSVQRHSESFAGYEIRPLQLALNYSTDPEEGMRIVEGAIVNKCEELENFSHNEECSNDDFDQRSPCDFHRFYFYEMNDELLLDFDTGTRIAAAVVDNGAMIAKSFEKFPDGTRPAAAASNFSQYTRHTGMILFDILVGLDAVYGGEFRNCSLLARERESSRGRYTFEFPLLNKSEIALSNDGGVVYFVPCGEPLGSLRADVCGEEVDSIIWDIEGQAVTAAWEVAGAFSRFQATMQDTAVAVEAIAPRVSLWSGTTLSAVLTIWLLALGVNGSVRQLVDVLFLQRLLKRKSQLETAMGLSESMSEQRPQDLSCFEYEHHWLKVQIATCRLGLSLLLALELVLNLTPMALVLMTQIAQAKRRDIAIHDEVALVGGGWGGQGKVPIIVLLFTTLVRTEGGENALVAAATLFSIEVIADSWMLLKLYREEIQAVENENQRTVSGTRIGHHPCRGQLVSSYATRGVSSRCSNLHV